MTQLVDETYFDKVFYPLQLLNYFLIKSHKASNLLKFGNSLNIFMCALSDKYRRSGIYILS